MMHLLTMLWNYFWFTPLSEYADQDWQQEYDHDYEETEYEEGGACYMNPQTGKRECE
jgi:hypothetical protein